MAAKAALLAVLADSSLTEKDIMASNFRHLTGCEDGTGTFCCYGKSRRRRQIAHWPRSARTHGARAGRCGLPDRRSSVKKLLSFVCLFVDVSFSSRINHRPRAACRVFKADVLRESKKNRHGIRAVRSTIEVGSCPSSFAYCEAEFDLGKGKNRSKAPYPH